MRKDTTKKRAGPKAKCRVENWAKYNAGLITRGDVTMWIDEEMCTAPPAQTPKRGHPLVYSEARGAVPSILPREGARHWPDNTPGASWRNAAIDAIANSTRREWKLASGYHRRSLAETLMYRLKVLTGSSLWGRTIGSQATEVSIRAGLLNRMAAPARPQSVRIA